MRRGDIYHSPEIEGVVTAVRDDSIVVWDGQHRWTVYHPILTEDMLYSTNGKEERLSTRDT